MKHLRQYENYKNVYDDYIEINLNDFNDEIGDNKLHTLRDMLIGKIVSFTGYANDDHYLRHVKGIITGVHFTGVWSYEFTLTSSNGIDHSFKVNNSIPIKIHTLEEDMNKYNI